LKDLIEYPVTKLQIKPMRKILTTLTILVMVTACSTDGGVETMTGQTQSAFIFPTVTAEKNVAPVIGALSGEAPTTLAKKDIFVGTGKEAIATSSLEVHYVLMKWNNGQVVQSSWDSGQTFSTPLSGVITGWQQGVPGMKEGGRRLLVIPADLAYGEMGNGPIEPNETIVFVVDLIKVS
jgi:peptidylprolyl isomerase